MNTKMLHGRTELAYQRSIMAKLDNELNKQEKLDKIHQQVKTKRNKHDDEEE